MVQNRSSALKHLKNAADIALAVAQQLQQQSTKILDDFQNSVKDLQYLYEQTKNLLEDPELSPSSVANPRPSPSPDATLMHRVRDSQPSGGSSRGVGVQSKPIHDESQASYASTVANHASNGREFLLSHVVLSH